VIRSETSESCGEEGEVKPMFARWLLQPFAAQPYSGIGHFNEATGPILVRQEAIRPIPKMNTHSLEDRSLVGEAGGSCAQERLSLTPKTPVADMESHRDVLAFCGSWQ
jgi:hypothetical protein